MAKLGTSVQLRDRVVPELHRLGLALGVFLLLGFQVVLLDGRGPQAAELIAVFVLCFSLITVTRWYAVSALLMLAALWSLSVLTPQLALVAVVPIVASYSVSLGIGRRQGSLLAVLAAIVLTFAPVTQLTALGMATNLLRNLVLLLAGVAFGDANRSRRERVIEAELRAEESERTRKAEADRAVDEERLRVARELHDITAHSLSVIAIQSELAKNTLSVDPVTAHKAIDAIGRVSRESLSELRVMLGQLRTSGAAERAPVPSLESVGDLVSSLELAGCEVSVVVAGETSHLSPFVDASAYRILQEATTNIIRHAPGGHVQIVIERTDTSLRLAVVNDGAAATRGSGGHGIIGMRERAAALGGTLTVGPEANGTWVVEAQLPIATTQGGERT